MKFFVQRLIRDSIQEGYFGTSCARSYAFDQSLLKFRCLHRRRRRS
jgi:hypothetical protein